MGTNGVETTNTHSNQQLPCILWATKPQKKTENDRYTNNFHFMQVSTPENLCKFGIDS